MIVTQGARNGVTNKRLKHDKKDEDNEDDFYEDNEDHDDDIDDNGNSDGNNDNGRRGHPCQREPILVEDGNRICAEEANSVLAIQGRIDEMNEEEQIALATRNRVRHQQGRDEI